VTDVEEQDRARFVAVLNAGLDMRRIKALPKEERRFVEELAAG
jgi:hypothetical protein